mgnify:CR=1 FL=1
MEENYLLAKKIVDKRFDNNSEHYYMFICALFGLFMKFPDNKDLIIKTFMDTKFIIEDIPVLDIQKKYNLTLIQEDELEVQDPNVCTNYGVSDLGFGYFIQFGKVQMVREKPMIVCTSKNNSPANLLNVFVPRNVSIFFRIVAPVVVKLDIVSKKESVKLGMLPLM